MDDVPDAEVTELKTIPQSLSRQAIPSLCIMVSVFVAQGMMIQSVWQLVPTTEPWAMAPPVRLNDMAGVLAKSILISCVCPS